MDIYDCYEILKDKYIRVLPPQDVKKIEIKDYPEAHENCRYYIIITNETDSEEHYLFKTKEERDNKFKELLFILNIQKTIKRLEDTYGK